MSTGGEGGVVVVLSAPETFVTACVVVGDVDVSGVAVVEALCVTDVGERAVVAADDDKEEGVSPGSMCMSRPVMLKGSPVSEEGDSVLIVAADGPNPVYGATVGASVCSPTEGCAVSLDMKVSSYESLFTDLLEFESTDLSVVDLMCTPDIAAVVHSSDLDCLEPDEVHSVDMHS